MAEGLLRHDDPRLGLTPEALSPRDAEAKLIVAVLENLLRHRQYGALAAPVAGFARRLLVIKSRNRNVPIFDPVLTSARMPLAVPDERHVLTGDLIRATCRAEAVTVSGTGVDGQALNVDAAGPIAQEVQQCLDLLAGDAPLRWLSAYQRAVVDRIATPARLNAALAGLVREATADKKPDDKGPEGAEPEDMGPRDRGPNDIAFDWPMLTLGGGTAIDLRDPGTPFDPALADLLSLSAIARDPERIMLQGDSLIALIAGLATRWHGTRLAFSAPGPAITRFLERLGDPSIAAVPETDPPRYPLALVDARMTIPAPKALAAALALPEGAAIVLASARDGALEHKLKSSFIDLHLARTPNAILYIATRLELDLPRALTGLVRAGEPVRWRDGVLRLDKDGQERPVAF